MSRDDFKQRTIKTLRERVSSRCSNPGCRVPTSAPSGNEKATNIGVAAHISAASPGGPRYRADISVSKRKSISNGIWLCSNCAQEIDRDLENYSAARLHDWKALAEQRAGEELGKSLPKKEDVLNALTTAFTGLPTGNLSSAIKNVHQAVDNSLGSLDERFILKSEYKDGHQQTNILAKENVSLNVLISGDDAVRSASKFSSLVKHGEEIDFDLQNLQFEGSKLFEHLLEGENNGKLVISPISKSAVQKLWITSPDSGEIERFDDLLGSLNLGSESCQFEGSACNGLVKLEYRHKYTPDKSSERFSLGLDFGNWHDIDVCQIPYFQKIYDFFDKLFDGWELHTALEIEGSTAFKFSSKGIHKEEGFKGLRHILQYIFLVRTVSLELKSELKYKEAFSFSIEELQFLHEACSLFRQETKVDWNTNDPNPTCEVAVSDKKALENMNSNDEAICIKFEDRDGVIINVFEQEIQLPRKAVYLNNFKINVLDENVKTGEGLTAKLELIPAENSVVVTSFIID